MLNQIKELKLLRIFTDIEPRAIMNFFILVFFTFMGTSIPFQERGFDAYEAETTNVVNQVVYIFLFFSSFIIIIQNPKRTLEFLRREKYLISFVSLCLISFLWSDYSLLSLKRSFQLLVTFITVLNAILYIRSENIILSLKIISFLYISVTFFSGMIIPQAIDPAFGSWRGIELHKNLLGHSSLMIFILGFYFFSESKNKLAKYSNLFLMVSSIIIIILSGSSTNMIGFLVVTLIWFVTRMDKYFLPLGIGRLFSNLLIIIVILISVVLSIYSTEILSIIPELFGKDLSFTGRNLIWLYIWNEVQQKFWLGYGYGSYWIMGTSVIDLFQAYVGWVVNEAHNGYLEIHASDWNNWIFIIHYIIYFFHS